MMTAFLVAETLTVFFVARHYGATFGQACRATALVNSVLTLGLMIAVSNVRKRL